MSNELFFQGDPATDSTRRHMERMLSGPPSRKFRNAAVAGAAAWGIWRLIRAVTPSKWKRDAAPRQQR